jgi:hypothetical protein
MAKEAGAEITDYVDYAFTEDMVLFSRDQLQRFAAATFTAGSKAAQPQSYEEQRAILIQYLQVMIARCDWHGVADVAMDLREMEAEQRGAK